MCTLIHTKLKKSYKGVENLPPGTPTSSNKSELARSAPRETGLHKPFFNLSDTPTLEHIVYQTEKSLCRVLYKMMRIWYELTHRAN